MSDRKPRGRSTRFSAIVVLLAAWSIWSASVASADVSQQDNIVKVTLQGAVQRDQDVYDDSQQPSFDIQVLYPGVNIQCHVGISDYGTDEPCGTQQTSNCPAYQCWSYAPTVADGFGELYVDYDGPDIPGYLEFQFTIDSTPPQTILHTPPNGVSLRPRFDVEASDDQAPVDGDQLQCAFSPASSPAGAWGSCGTLGPLKPTGIYRLQARAVDLFGRPDPSPAEYVFSPTPCRLLMLGHVRSVPQIVKHGVRVRVHCVQPTQLTVSMPFPLSVVERFGLPVDTLGYINLSTTSQDQTRTIDVGVLRGIPRKLVQFLTSIAGSSGNRFRIDLGVYPSGYGAPVVVRDILHRR